MTNLLSCACLAIRLAVFVFRGILLHEPSAAFGVLFNCEMDRAAVFESSSVMLSSIEHICLKTINLIKKQ